MDKNKLNEEDYCENKEENIVFTKKFPLKRGYSCGNGCAHCPSGNFLIGQAERQKS